MLHFKLERANVYQDQFKKLFDSTLTVGMKLDDLFIHTPSHKSKLVQQWLDSLRYAQDIHSLEFEKDGKKYTFELSSNQIVNELNERSGLLHTVRDITQSVREHKALAESYKKQTDSMIELERKNEQITLLVDMSDVMLATNSLEELSAVIGKYAQRLLSFSSGHLYIMHPSKDYLEMVCTWGTPKNMESYFHPDQCWAIRLGSSRRIISSNNDLRCEHLRFSGDIANNVVCLPLMAQNDIYGLLYMEIEQESFKFNEEQQLSMTAFSELIALALANVRLRENLRYQSIRDPLTGLYNRRFLEDNLLKQKLHADQSKTSFAIFMFDLDHFKKINDSFGHDAGDAVLKEVGSLLERTIRPGDVASRYGGEEFMLILHDVDLDEAKSRAEEIRLAVSKLQIKYGAQPIGPITISVGIALYPQDSNDTDKLIELADKVLYIAKTSGRNKVVAISELHGKQR